MHTLYHVFLCTVLLPVLGMLILYGLLSHQIVGKVCTRYYYYFIIIIIIMPGILSYSKSSYSSIDTLVTVCCAVVRSNLQYASIAWNFVTLTESSKIGRVHKIFANLR